METFHSDQRQDKFIIFDVRFHSPNNLSTDVRFRGRLPRRAKRDACCRAGLESARRG
jgi:hypothetical protein